MIYFIEGFTEGFSLDRDHVHVLSDQFSSYTPSLDLLHYNHNSALHHADIITDKLNLESEKGRLAVPFDELPLSGFKVSPLALVEKKAKAKYCLIHNWSFLEGDSVNDQIEKHKGSNQYQTLDSTIGAILTLGPGCTLGKTDIHHTFKIIPVQPSDWSKHFFKFQLLF